jgi:RES domain-containing protein
VKRNCSPVISDSSRAKSRSRRYTPIVTQSFQPGTFAYNATTTQFAFSGVLYRTIPSYSNEPLTARFSIEGGRWNPPNTHLVLYTYSAVQTAQVAFTNYALNLGIDIANVNPEFHRDMVVLQLNLDHLADVATNMGLQNFGLPQEYPVGFKSEADWTKTRPIGQKIYASGAGGIVTRSASLSEWSGPIEGWAEVAVFPDRCEAPVLVERLAFSDWFYR